MSSATCSTFRSSSNCSVQPMYLEGSDDTAPDDDAFHSVVSIKSYGYPSRPVSESSRHWPQPPRSSPPHRGFAPTHCFPDHSMQRSIKSNTARSSSENPLSVTATAEPLGMQMPGSAPFSLPSVVTRPSRAVGTSTDGSVATPRQPVPRRVPTPPSRCNRQKGRPRPKSARTSQSSVSCISSRASGEVGEGAAGKSRVQTAQSVAMSTFEVLGRLLATSGGLLQRFVVPEVDERNTSAGPQVEMQEIDFDDSHEPFSANDRDPQVRVVSAEEFENEMMDELDDMDMEPRIEVDLVSAIHGYLQNPNEVFGHLVAAALSSRSIENPVTGLELSEAQSHPYLVSMIVNSGCLDVTDPIVQLEIQRCVDTLVNSSSDGKGLDPGIHEYLCCLCQLSFVRLTQSQYELFQISGFEFVKLLYDYPHIHPNTSADFRSKSRRRLGGVFQIFVMLVDVASRIFCNVSIALIVAFWMTDMGGNYRQYGYYTLMVYGGGYAIYLVLMVFILKTKVPSTYYEYRILPFPSANMNIVPVVPIYDAACIYSYIRCMLDPRPHFVMMNDLRAATQIASICHALCYSFPQLVAQAYFLDLGGFKLPPSGRRDYSYNLLKASTCLHWVIALARFAISMFLSHSVTVFGLACFARGRGHIVQRGTEFPYIILYIHLFVLEMSIYFILVGARRMLQCWVESLVVVVLAGVTIFIVCVAYILLILTKTTIRRVAFLIFPTVAIQLALWIFTGLSFTRCNDRVLKENFIFGYLAWAAMYLALTLWVVRTAYFLLIRPRLLQQQAPQGVAQSGLA